jgi:hypothetical protein
MKPVYLRDLPNETLQKKEIIILFDDAIKYPNDFFKIRSRVHLTEKQK